MFKFFIKLLSSIMKEREMDILKVVQFVDDNRIFVQAAADNLKGEMDFELIVLDDLDDSRLEIFVDGEDVNLRLYDLKKFVEKPELIDDDKIEKIVKYLNEDIDKIKTIQDYLEANLKDVRLEDYIDITDKLFNRFSEIDKSTITSQGLWCGNGVRYIKLNFSNSEELDKFLNLTKGEGSQKKRLIIDKKNNNYLDEVLEFKVVKRDNNFILELDTDKFLDILGENEKEADFEGFLHFEIFNEYKLGINFKFLLKIKNAQAIEDDVISIDFGTSSTCVAYKGGKELIAFTDNPQNIKDYENQTSIVIFNWKKIYKAWGNPNNTIPHFVRSKFDEESDKVDIKKYHYNYSNYVKKELQEAPSAKFIEAVIKDFKSLPYKMMQDRENKEYVKPFDDFKNKLFLTDLVEEENEETLNPIAFYGYLIGRNLNLQIRDSVYLRYRLTMPVNFSKKEKEIIQNSIEYGLKRALPKRLKDKIEVVISFDEPVAVLGAAKKMKYFKFKDLDKDAFLCAIFDFGGGTLDFAFGLYRKSLKDERAIIENEFNKYKEIVEIFKTDGVRVGGERLIDALSYEIYKINKDKMKDENIPIYVPDGEERIEFYPDKLMGNRHIDRLNLQSLNEAITREFFINGEIKNTTVALFSLDDETKEKEIELDLPKERLEEFLEERIFDLVENFKYILENVFNSFSDRIKEFGYDEFNLEDVKIFKVGNTSKSRFVEKAFNDLFEDANIFLLEEDKGVKSITAKNAVARGALFLNGVGVYNHSKKDFDNLPLDRYIWNYEYLEDGDITPVLEKGDNELVGFKYIGRRGENSFKIYFSDIRAIEDEDDDSLKYIDIKIDFEIEDNKTFVFVKPFNKSIVKIGFSDNNEVCEEEHLELDLETLKKRFYNE